MSETISSNRGSRCLQSTQLEYLLTWYADIDPTTVAPLNFTQYSRMGRSVRRDAHASIRPSSNIILVTGQYQHFISIKLSHVDTASSGSCPRFSRRVHVRTKFTCICWCVLTSLHLCEAVSDTTQLEQQCAVCQHSSGEYNDLKLSTLADCVGLRTTPQVTVR